MKHFIFGIFLNLMLSTSLSAQDEFMPSVVLIEDNEFGNKGTGVVIGQDQTKNVAYILTALHVISDTLDYSKKVSSKLKVTFFDKRNTPTVAPLEKVEKVFVGPDNIDVAVLKIILNNPRNCKGLIMAQRTSLKLGDKVFCIGHPIGGTNWFKILNNELQDLPKNNNSYKFSISNNNQLVKGGCSGGPVFNGRKHLMGIMTQTNDYQTKCILIDKIFSILASKEWESVNYNCLVNFVPPPGMSVIPSSTFTMGKSLISSENPNHEVQLKAFAMDEHEVTNEAFCVFLNDQGHKNANGPFWIEEEYCAITKKNGKFVVKAKNFEQYPVYSVTWYGAAAYCDWRGEKFRLPTEAEWEVAARGDQDYAYAGSVDPNEVAHFAKPEDKVPVQVRGKKPNGFGLFDMSGNVLEWCQDFFEPYRASTVQDPKGPYTGKYKVLRGGSWKNSSTEVTVTKRFQKAPDSKDVGDIGFRCVMDIE